MHRSLMVTSVMVFSSVMHLIWCYLFVNIWGMGVTGASLAMMISYGTNFTLITLLCKASKSL